MIKSVTNVWIMACWWCSPIYFGPLVHFPITTFIYFSLLGLFHLLTARTSWSTSIKHGCITDYFSITWSHHFTKRGGWVHNTNQIPPLFSDICMWSKDIGRSCILVLWVSILLLSLFFPLYFEIVLFDVFLFAISLLGEAIYQKIRLMSVF